MGSGPGQNATVEEILASIRQAIAEDDAKRAVSRPEQSPGMDAEVQVEFVTHGGSTEIAMEEAAIAAVEADATADMQETAGGDLSGDVPEVIGQAIDQAIDGVRAEIEAERATFAGRYARAGFHNTVPRAASRPLSSTARRQMTAIPRPPTLLSNGPDEQVSASFDRLAKAMISGDGTKLDSAVEEVLRPMLKTWLDTNLPQLVERLVREEIERVSRGRR